MIARPVAVALACLLAWPAVSAHPDETVGAGQATTQIQAASAPVGTPTSGRSPGLLGRKSPKGKGFKLGREPGDGAGELLLQMMAYVVVILALGGVALFLIKRVLPRLRSGQGNKNIAVLETVYLGPKRPVHLLQVGSERFLVAGSRDGIALLGKVTSAFSEESEPDATTTEEGGFRTILKGRDAGPDTDKS